MLGAARVANTVYIALKSTDKATGQSYVFAAVILISNTQKDGFGYKDMDESVGPCECACPDRIMRLLSPIADIPNPGYAADWRARVAAQKTAAAELRTKRKRLMPGAIITLQNEVRFRDGKTATAFRMRFYQAQNADLRAARPARILVPPLRQKPCRGNRHAAGRHDRRSACLTIRGDHDDEQSGRFQTACRCRRSVSQDFSGFGNGAHHTRSHAPPKQRRLLRRGEVMVSFSKSVRAPL